MASPLKRRHSLSYHTGHFLCIMGFRVFFLNVLSAAWVTYELMDRASSSQDFRWTKASIIFPRYHCDSLSFNATLRSSRFVDKLLFSSCIDWSHTFTDFTFLVIEDPSRRYAVYVKRELPSLKKDASRRREGEWSTSPYLAAILNIFCFHTFNTVKLVKIYLGFVKSDFSNTFFIHCPVGTSVELHYPNVPNHEPQGVSP